MSSFGAVLDACVIVPAALRDILIRAAAAGLYRVYWSEDILEEVRRTLVERGMTDEVRAQRLVDTLCAYAPESSADGYRKLVTSMTNDPGDRHVLAAAVATNSQVIVTANLRHFPEDSLAPYGIEAQLPDTFLTDLFDLHPSLMIKIICEQVDDLKAPTKTYNCIAWAMGDTARKWWPPAGPWDIGFWPPAVSRSCTIESFARAFQSVGYKPCRTGDLERGWEKVALYADSQGIPKHAVRQLPSGKWTSKLGDEDDIEHEKPEAVEGQWYGEVVRYFRRRRRS